MPAVDYKAIADQYVAGGYGDIDAAYSAMSEMEVLDENGSATFNRAQILAELGATTGLSALSVMTAALKADTDLDASAEEILLDLISSENGLDMAHESTQELLTKWRDSSPPETNGLFDALLGLGRVTKPVFPGITRGQIATALSKREREVI